MPASVSTDIHASDSCQVLLGAVSCACLCVKEPRAFDAFSALVLSTTSNLISTLCVFFVVISEGVTHPEVYCCHVAAPQGGVHHVLRDAGVEGEGVVPHTVKHI